MATRFTHVLEKLYQVKAPHFTAGLVSRDGKVVDAAPILRWTMGRREYGVMVYCRRKAWNMEMISSRSIRTHGATGSASGSYPRG